MTQKADYTHYSRVRLSQRQLVELLGLCHGLVADGKINQREAESLHAWLIAQRKFANSSARVLQKRLEEMSEGEKLDKNESLAIA